MLEVTMQLDNFRLGKYDLFRIPRGRGVIAYE